MKYNLKDTLSVEFILENCETILVPCYCFKEFELIEYNNMGIYELHCIIDKQDDLIYNDFNSNKTSPIRRLHENQDITSCHLVLFDGKMIHCKLVWYDVYGSNKFQETKLVSFNKIEISVKRIDRKKATKEKHQLKLKEIISDIRHYRDCDDCWCQLECMDLDDARGINICDVLDILTEEEI